MDMTREVPKAEFARVRAADGVRRFKLEAPRHDPENYGLAAGSAKTLS